MKFWHWSGLMVFALMTGVEMGDFTGLFQGLFALDQYAQASGLTTGQTLLRLIVLCLLTLGIAVASGWSLLGILQSGAYFSRASAIAAGLMVLYGLFQMVSATFLVAKMQSMTFTAGLVYLLLGVLAFFLSRKVLQVI